MRTKLQLKASVVFIFITIFLDMLAIGIIVPVLPKLIENFLGGDTAKAAQYIGIFGTVWALMQFIFSPILGVLSDRVGRRPVVLISNVGLGLDYILMAAAPNLRWLFIGRIISGITASSISAANGYIADVTPSEKKSAAFGLMGVAFGVGFILGPAIGGFFGEINPRLPFAIAAGLSLLNALYGFFVLPESLTPANRVPFSWKKANPIGSLKLLKSNLKLYTLSQITFLLTLAHAVLPSIVVIYCTYRYNWSTRTVGLLVAAVGLTNGIVQGTLVGPFVKKLGEQKVLLLGLLCGAIGFSIHAMAPTGNYFWIGVPFLALWGLGNAAIQGMMSQQVGSQQQGQLQGAIGSLRGISEMIGPGMFTFTFAYFIQANHLQIPGSPFYLAALLMLIAIAVLVKRNLTIAEKV